MRTQPEKNRKGVYMKYEKILILGVLVPLLSGCVQLYETPLLPLEPVVKESNSVTLGLRGFGLTTREIVGNSIGFSSANVSGSSYNANTGLTTFNGTGSATTSSLNFGDKTSEAVFLFARNELEENGFYLQANNPDYILEGRLGGPYTKFGCWNFWLEAPFVLGTIFTYYSLPSEGWCELRIYDGTGHFVKSYQAEELRLYRQLGFPYFAVFNQEALSPFARRRVVYSAVNSCLNQFFSDVKNGRIQKQKSLDVKQSNQSSPIAIKVKGSAL